MVTRGFVKPLKVELVCTTHPCSLTELRYGTVIENKKKLNKILV